MKTIGAAKFKEQCLAVLDQLDTDGIVITKHGKPVAKLVPWEQSSSSMIGAMKGRIRIHGDILSTGMHWDAES
jgi:prevent-host-death family protein